MNGQDFSCLIDVAFVPFLSELGFSVQPLHVSGRYYRASFIGSRYTLLITFEPGDEQVMVMLLENGDDDLRSIDDPMKTLRLSHLNARYMGQVTAESRSKNEAFFSTVEVNDAAARSLLKCAKDLRLVLPLHLAS